MYIVHCQVIAVKVLIYDESHGGGSHFSPSNSLDICVGSRNIYPSTARAYGCVFFLEVSQFLLPYYPFFNGELC